MSPPKTLGALPWLPLLARRGHGVVHRPAVEGHALDGAVLGAAASGGDLHSVEKVFRGKGCSTSADSHSCTLPVTAE